MRNALLWSLVVFCPAAPLFGQWQQLLGDTAVVWGLHTYGDTVVAGTYDGRIFFSGDLGMSWQERTGDLGSGVVDNIAVAAGGRLVCTSSAGIWISDDWLDWTLVHSMNGSATCMVVRDSTIIVGAEFSGGLHATFDNGANWTPISTTAPGGQYSTSVGLRSDTIFWTRFSAGGTLQSVDWGANWTAVTALSDTYFALSENARYVGDETQVKRSVGNSWMAYTTDWQVLDFAVDGQLTAAGGDGGDEVLLSGNAGVDWLEVPIVGVQRVEFGGNYLFAGGGSGLWRMNALNYLGIPDRSNDKNVRLFPDPATDHAWLTWTNSDQPDAVRIFDPRGRLLRALDRRSSEREAMWIDTADLAPGCYHLIAHFRTSSVAMQLVVVR